MKRIVAALALGLTMTAQTGFALTADEAVADLRAAGFTRIEVKVGATQMKVEAIRGTEKLEVVYDRVSGAVLKSEVETVGVGETTAPGVSVRNRDRDFVRVADRRSDDDSDDDDGRRGRGADDAPGDDNGGDRGGRGRGSDDDGDDDKGDDGDDDDSGDDKGDDKGGDDNGGDRDRGGDDD